MLENREDVSGVKVVDYSTLIAKPEMVMAHMRYEGWPIDPLEAAAVIDPAQYRFRRELLTVGI